MADYCVQYCNLPAQEELSEVSKTKMGWLLVMGAIALLMGCGQKGPLYLPDAPHQQQTIK